MKEVKFYKSATLILIVLNLVIVACFIFGRPKPPGPGQHPPFAHRATELMKLDETQLAQFEELVKIHREDMESLNGLQKELLDSYFKNIYDAKNAPSNDYQLKKLQTIEGQKVESTYRHFEEIKALLQPEQLDGFEQFMRGAMNQILTGKQRNQGPLRP